MADGCGSTRAGDSYRGDARVRPGHGLQRQCDRGDGGGLRTRVPAAATTDRSGDRYRAVRRRRKAGRGALGEVGVASDDSFPRPADGGDPSVYRLDRAARTWRAALSLWYV